VSHENDARIGCCAGAVAPSVNLDRALQLAAELEDEELVRKMRVGK
jgi:hypothetical protein